MPWHVAESGDCPSGEPWAVIKDSDGSIAGCHGTKAKAEAQLAALYANEERNMARENWFQRFMDRILGGVQERAISVPRIYDQIGRYLRENDLEGWPLDVFVDSAEFYVVIARGGALFKVPLTISGDDVILGEWVKVTEVHQPVAERMTITRQQDGRVRWLNISASAVLNRQAEIDSRALFDAMVARAEETGQYPYRTFYHQGEAMRIGMTDLLARDGNLYITSGLFDDNPLAVAVVRALEAEPDYWGDSIGYLPLGDPQRVEVAEGITVPVYTDGVHRETSTLPRHRAASFFTVPTITTEVARMRTEVLEALERLRDKHGLPQEDLDEFVALADTTNRATDELITRDTDEEPVDDDPELDADLEAEDDEDDEDEEAATEDPALEGEGERETEDLEFELDDEAISALVDRMAESDQFMELAGQVQGLVTLEQQMRGLEAQLEQRTQELGSRVALLEQDEAEQQERWLADQPRRRRVIVTHRPRAANDPAAEPEPVQERGALAEEAEDTLSGIGLSY